LEIKIKSFVKPDVETVFSRFDLALFKELAPPFPKTNVLRFDGCQSGDVVAIELDFVFFKQKWESLITYFHKTDKEIIFVDTGSVLPFFLKTWEHRHIIVKTKEGGSLIIDHIFFSSGFFLFDWFLYPVLRKQFADRKPIYKRYFGG
jgi:ligand-binding SRPBCC domain-containing protein